MKGVWPSAAATGGILNSAMESDTCVCNVEGSTEAG